MVVSLVALETRVTAALAREPLSAIGAAARRELDAVVAQARDFEDLPGKWQAAILQAESEGPAEPAAPGGCCHGSAVPAAAATAPPGGSCHGSAAG